MINVTTRENDLFDACFEWGLHLGLRTSIGQGLGRAGLRWHDLWIDQPQTLAGLAALGHPLADPPRRICHWSPYLRPGTLADPPRRICHWSPYLRPGTIALYRALIDGRLAARDLPLHLPSRRWSRLILGGRGFGIGTGLPAA